VNFNFNPVEFMSKIGPGQVRTFDDCLKMDLAMVLEGDMLTKTDRMSMFNGLEVRVPFLDHELVDLVTRIPANQKISFNNQKKLLRENFSYLLPTAILNKKKHGFEVPLGRWLKTMLPAGKKDLLSADFIANQSLFNPAVVDRVISQFNTSAAGSEYTYWNLLVFNSWWASNREYFSG
jgi:asparagine synthase (glutamine-hydrolysing)